MSGEVIHFVEDDGSHVFVINEGPAGPAGPPGPAGSVIGPVTSVVGNLPVFADTTGDTISDSGVLLANLATNSGVAAALAGKVDKVTGMGLSEEDFTTARKDKLDALSLGGFRGTFDNETDLVATIPIGEEGDYAETVDPVPGEELNVWFWDEVNQVWTKVAPGSTPSTGAEIKTALFAESDTNNFDDNAKTKLDNTVSQATFDSVIQTLTGGSAPTTNVVDDNTTARILSPSDAGKLIILQNASPCTITVNNDATALWTIFPPISFYVSSGIPVVVAGSGVTIVDAASILSSLAPGDTFTLKKIGPDLWITVVGM